MHLSLSLRPNFVHTLVLAITALVCFPLFAYDDFDRLQNMPETIALSAEWIVIAKQTGPLMHLPIDDVAVHEVSESDFVVKRFL